MHRPWWWGHNDVRRYKSRVPRCSLCALAICIEGLGDRIIIFSSHSHAYPHIAFEFKYVRRRVSFGAHCEISFGEITLWAVIHKFRPARLLRERAVIVCDEVMIEAANCMGKLLFDAWPLWVFIKFDIILLAIVEMERDGYLSFGLGGEQWYEHSYLDRLVAEERAKAKPIRRFVQKSIALTHSHEK